MSALPPPPPPDEPQPAEPHRTAPDQPSQPPAAPAGPPAPPAAWTPADQPPPPGAGYRQPGPGYQQAVPGHQQAAPGYRQPGPGQQHSGHGYQPPATGYQQPRHQGPGPGPEAHPGYGSAPGAAPQSPWAATATRPPRRSRRWVVALGVVLALALGGGTTAVLVDRANEQRAAQELADRQAREAQELADAEEAYDTAVADLDERITSLGTLATDVDTALTTAGEDRDAAGALLDAAAADVVPAAERAALDTARTDLDTTLNTWDQPTTMPERPAERPTTTAEILEATEALEAGTATADTTLADTQKALDALETQRVGLTDTAEALLATVPGTSQFYLDTHPVATNASRSAMQVAADGVVGSWSPSSSTELAGFTAAAQAVATSQVDQEWLLANPVHPARPEIEAFARSLSGGVPIDFSWAPEVNGAGPDGNSGGLATWTTAEYGYSTIQLSDNVAELWPDAGIQALVVHETGHAITSKCYDLYAAPPFNSDDEMFATAWAISMGYDDGNGSGEWAYGRPSDEQIAAAYGCR